MYIICLILWGTLFDTSYTYFFEVGNVPGIIFFLFCRSPIAASSFTTPALSNWSTVHHVPGFKTVVKITAISISDFNV